MIGDEGTGFNIAMNGHCLLNSRRLTHLLGLNGGRINIASCSLGGAQAALEDSVNYTQERSQFGKQLAGFQVTAKSIRLLTTRVERSV